jgi:hypothetical protein
MTRPAKMVLVAAASALLYGGYEAYSRMKEPEPGSRAWQVQQFRKDWKACDKFAGKREEARRLLAWEPKPWISQPGTDAWNKEYEQRREEELAELRERTQNMDADMKAHAARWQADEYACLRDIGWPDVQIQTLKKEVREADEKKLR